MKIIKSSSYSEYKKLITTYQRNKRLINYTSYVEGNKTIYVIEIE